MKYFLLFSTFFFTLTSYSLECPPNHSIVEYDSVSGVHIAFCQHTVGGKIVKNGPEVHTDKTGKVVKKLFYKDGELQKEEKVVEKKKEVKVDTSLVEIAYEIAMGRIFDSLMERTSNGDSELIISKIDRGRCLTSPKNRLNFLVRGVPYSENYQFRDNCHRKGTINYQFDKPFPVKMEFRKSPPFQFADYKVLVKKKTLSQNSFQISTTITEGKIYSKGLKEVVEFEMDIIFTVKISEVIATRGYGGIFLDKGEFRGLTQNGKPVKFVKDRKIPNRPKN